MTAPHDELVRAVALIEAADSRLRHLAQKDELNYRPSNNELPELEHAIIQAAREQGLLDENESLVDLKAQATQLQVIVSDDFTR